MCSKKIRILEQLVVCKEYHFNTTSDNDVPHGHTSTIIVQYPNCQVVAQEPLETKLMLYKQKYGPEVCVEDSDEYTALFSKGEKNYRFSFLIYQDHTTRLMDVGFKVKLQLIGSSSHSPNGAHFFADGVIGWKSWKNHHTDANGGLGTLFVCPEMIHLNHEKPLYRLQMTSVQNMIKLTDFSPFGEYSRLLKEGLQFLCGVPHYYFYHPELKEDIEPIKAKKKSLIPT